MLTVGCRASTLILIAALLSAACSNSVSAAEADLIFSVKSWEGEYSSADIPGGVQSTPTLGAIYAIRADGRGLKRIVGPGASIDYPAAERQWVYFQSKMTVLPRSTVVGGTVRASQV